MTKLKMTWDRVGDELVCRWVEQDGPDARRAEESSTDDARLSELEWVVARAA